MTPRSTLTDRIRSDLQPRVSGELYTDPETLERYSRTQGWYSIRPLAVVCPTTIEDVQAAVRLATSLGVSVIPRGAGTGLAGHGIGFGIIIDTSVHLTQIGPSTDGHITVQPGVVLSDLNAHVRHTGHWFPVDPTSASRCTLGGMIATNASGWHRPLYGATKDHVRSIRIVVSDGTVLDIGPPEATSVDQRVQTLRGTLESLLRPYASEVQHGFPDVSKNSSGYNIRDALASRPIDLRKLIVGSEGTVGIVVDADVDLHKLPASVGGLLIRTRSYDAIGHALDLLREIPYAAAEVLDPTFLEHADFAAAWGVEEGSIILYLDMHSDSDDERDDLIARSRHLLAPILDMESSPIVSQAERQHVLDSRQQASESINLNRERSKVSFIEDGTVPVDRLPEYVSFLKTLLDSHGISYTLYGHAGDGNIHCSPFMDIRNLDHYRMIDEIAFRVADKLSALGGSLSGEHGDGFVRTPLLEKMYGSTIYSLFGQVKRTFDPTDTFHPGVIIGPQNVSIAHDLSFD